jgi:hypothetical protein
MELIFRHDDRSAPVRRSVIMAVSSIMDLVSVVRVSVGISRVAAAHRDGQQQGCRQTGKRFQFLHRSIIQFMEIVPE